MKIYTHNSKGNLTVSKSVGVVFGQFHLLGDLVFYLWPEKLKK